MNVSVRLPGTPTGGQPLLCVAIGASAGGPSAIEAVLREFPWNFPVPIVVCQHMTDGATGPWAYRLNDACHIQVHEAEQGDLLKPHHAYIAPIGRHMRIRGTAEDAHVSLEPDRKGLKHVPSIDEMMRSVAGVFGSRCLGVVLTGMGSDGAEGLLAIRQAGGVTLAQTAESAFMGSMPTAAADSGAASEVVPLEKMAAIVTERVLGKV
jgi:two-component system chemotaxis response regulator CheB